MEAEHKVSGLVREAIDFREGKLPWVVIEKRCVLIAHKDDLRRNKNDEVAIIIKFPGTKDNGPALLISDYSNWPAKLFPSEASAYEYVIALYRSGERSMSEVYDCLSKLPEEYIKTNLPEIYERRGEREKERVGNINKEIQQLQKEIEKLQSELPK